MRVYKGGIQRPGVMQVPCYVNNDDNLDKAMQEGKVTFTEDGTNLNDYKYTILGKINGSDRYLIKILDRPFKNKCFFQFIELEEAAILKE